jgi:hypothetical protein
LSSFTSTPFFLADDDEFMSILSLSAIMPFYSTLSVSFFLPSTHNLQERGDDTDDDFGQKGIKR